MTQSRARGLRSFTLLELLVVVAVLAMLIGIMLPSLHRGREQAREVQCKNRLRSLYQAHLVYLHDYGTFPLLNKEEDDGAWQYNYLIYDGACADEEECDGFDYNFGPLVEGGQFGDIEMLFCPVQTDPYHSLSTYANPWPPKRNLDTRSAYARRYHLSGRRLEHFHGTIAIAADVLHLPAVINSAHKTGLNAVYSDGHAQFVSDPGIFTDNELAHPFDPLDNEIMEDIWDALDERP